MGVIYYVLLAPKFRDHDYYELMMLPAAALWATRGLLAVASRLEVRFAISGRRVVAAALTIAVVAHSPWVFGEFFRQDEAKLVLARRLDALCPRGARVVAIGPGIEFPTVIHYSHREGWPVHSPELPDDWRTRLDGFRDSGAALVAVYFGPKTTDAERASYAPLLRALPVVETRSGLPTRSSGTSDYVILDLRASRVEHRSRSHGGEGEADRR